MEKAIITVVGRDQVGIIAHVCQFLSKANINILDISQTILDGYFNMMMIVDMSLAKESFSDVCDQLEDLGNHIGVYIKLQHEDSFNKMHRI